MSRTGKKIADGRGDERQAHPSGTGRQGAGHRVRRCRPRGRGRGRAHLRLSTTPARIAPPPAASMPARRSTTGWSPTWRAAVALAEGGHADDSRRRDGPADLGRAAQRVAGFVERAAAQRSTSRSTTGGKTRAGAASSTSPRSSPARGRSDEIVQREVFGPVVSVTRFKDADEARSPGRTIPNTASPPRCGPRMWARR